MIKFESKVMPKTSPADGRAALLDLDVLFPHHGYGLGEIAGGLLSQEAPEIQ
jgi:hypothetical protein